MRRHHDDVSQKEALFSVKYELPDRRALIGTARHIARSYAKGALAIGLISWLIALMTSFYGVMSSVSLSLFVAGTVPVIIGIAFLRMSHL
jgi:ABC-type Mn2+/Zn2+ transport system permease subunit